MPYYTALKAKWPDLSGSTGEKLAQINALTVVGPAQPVSIVDAVTYLRRHGLWLPIKAAAASGASMGAAAAVDLNDDPRAGSIDFSLPIVQMMVGDLIDKNLLSKDQAGDLAALGASSLPWWQASGYSSSIGTGDLEAAGLS